ncbi:ATP-dependent DNA helicase Rep [uncultured archaeon]|nr:ATP-dependent DNA helicase Rep [uncultured archaeon]
MQKEVIKEIGPGKELDYLYVLRALNEIQFPVGKGLLVDFLTGEMKNQSIQKNDLYLLNNFKVLKKYSESEVKAMVDNLITNSMIEQSGLIGNKFAQVLGITQKGREELIEPSLHKKKLGHKMEIVTSQITDEERVLFKELDFFLNKYNDEQKKAIILQKQKILCIAGAGSGKTSVLVKRIEFLTKYQSADPQKILAITFTRKARQEMELRLRNLGVYGVQVETFNSFCEKILQKYARLIYSTPKRVMGYADKVIAMNFALDMLGMDLDSATDKYFSDNQKKNKEQRQLSNIFMNDCFSVLEYFKSKGEPLYDFSTSVSDFQEREIAKTISNICKSLDQQMKMQGLRDYTDQILDTIGFFEKNKNYIPEFENVLVDEYQDVNAMQIKLLDLLLEKNPKANLFAVGDPRQSIFGWRGSDINYILKFREKHLDCEIVNLIKNYRSKKKIVDFMNHSIKSMSVPDLHAHHSDDAEINISDFESEEVEHLYVINNVKEFLKAKISGDEIFVLARTNRQLNELSTKMKLEQIPHVLKTDELKNPIMGNPGDVTLATIHAIKGLEAKIVFVIGCNEVNFPCKASDHPVIEIVKTDLQEYDKEEEERRLFYVAISRAKEKLFLTYTGKKPTYFINDEMKKVANSWF